MPVLGVGFQLEGSTFLSLECRSRVGGLGLGFGVAARRNVQRFRGRLVFKGHSLLHLSTLCSSVIKKKRRVPLMQGLELAYPPGHLWRDKWTALTVRVEGSGCVVYFHLTQCID